MLVVVLLESHERWEPGTLCVYSVHVPKISEVRHGVFCEVVFGVVWRDLRWLGGGEAVAIVCVTCRIMGYVSEGFLR